MPGCRTSAVPVSAPVPWTTLTTPGGKPIFVSQLRQHQGRQGRNLGRLQDDRIPTRQDRCEFDGRVRQREVPRHDRRNRTHRFAKLHRDVVRQRAIAFPGNLVGEPRITFEQIRRARHVKTACVTNRLADIPRIGHGEVFELCTNPVGQLIAAGGRGSSGSIRGQGPSSKARRAARTARSTSSAAADGNIRQPFSRRRVRHRPCTPAAAIGPGTVNIQLIHRFRSKWIPRATALATVPTRTPASKEHGMIHTILVVSGRPRSFEQVIEIAVAILAIQPRRRCRDTPAFRMLIPGVI